MDLYLAFRVFWVYVSYNLWNEVGAGAKCIVIISKGFMVNFRCYDGDDDK